jgi:hypothetical protein
MIPINILNTMKNKNDALYPFMDIQNQSYQVFTRPTNLSWIQYETNGLALGLGPV